MPVSVALVEPLYHVNVGHIARLMKNFGLGTLYFVNPKFDREEAIKYSTHGKGILKGAKKISFEELRSKFDVLVGTTAIRATSRLNVLRGQTSPEELAELIRDVGRSKSFCIVLGRESSGLNNHELASCDVVVTIDTKTKYMTLNVAHSLCILLYELTRLKSRKTRNTKKRIDLASKKDIDLFLHYVDIVAEASNYDKHKKPLLTLAAKKVLTKSSPNVKDVMLMVSLLRRCMLAMERSGQPMPYADLSDASTASSGTPK